MKLRAKFNVLIISLLLVIIALGVYITISLSSILDLSRYGMTAQKARASVASIAEFSDALLAREFDEYKFFSNWNDILTTTNNCFEELAEKQHIVAADTELYEKMTGVLKMWKTVSETSIARITARYEELDQLRATESYFSQISKNGLINGINKVREVENPVRVLLVYGQILTNQSTVDYVATTFATKVTEICDLLEARITMRQRRFLGIFIAGVLVMAVMVFSIVQVLTHNITKRIRMLRAATGRLSAGDLEIDIADKTNDEVGDLVRDLNGTIRNFDEFLRMVKKTAFDAIHYGGTIDGAATLTADATGQIRASIDVLNDHFSQLEESVSTSMQSLENMSAVGVNLMEANKEQSAAIDENARDISQITATINTITRQTEENARNAVNMQKLILDGDEKIHAANDILKVINDQLDEMREIVTIINAVSEQTNILSMNAAIESAHAGDAGKGFGVVAEEIRNLAESTGENSRRISDAINNIIEKVSEAGEASIIANEAFALVSSNANGVASLLGEINSGILSVDSRIRQIEMRSKAITGTAERINGESIELHRQQDMVVAAMDVMNGMFKDSKKSVTEIDSGATDIVQRTGQVKEMSSESMKKMELLSNSLEQFHTRAASDEEDAAAGDVLQA